MSMQVKRDKRELKYPTMPHPRPENEDFRLGGRMATDAD